jgi:hypothetical protein
MIKPKVADLDSAISEYPLSAIYTLSGRKPTGALIGGG